MTCEEVLKYLQDYVDGELTLELKRAIEEHLERCFICRKIFMGYQKTINLFRKAFLIEMPEELKKKLSQFLFSHKTKKE